MHTSHNVCTRQILEWVGICVTQGVHYVALYFAVCLSPATFVKRYLPDIALHVIIKVDHTVALLKACARNARVYPVDTYVYNRLDMYCIVQQNNKIIM